MRIKNPLFGLVRDDFIKKEDEMTGWFLKEKFKRKKE